MLSNVQQNVVLRRLMGKLGSRMQFVTPQENAIHLVVCGQPK